MYSKYYLYKKQVSYDSGVTWSDVTPLETAPSGNPIATYATLEECNGQSPSYSAQYLTFVATESGTFKFLKSTGNTTDIQYSLDSGSTWTTLASDTNSPTVESGHTIMWKGTLTPIAYYNWRYPCGVGKFSSSGRFTAQGNPMSLLFGDNFSGQTSLNGKSYAFATLFSGATTLTSAENLSLLATTLAPSCYYDMFNGCTSLTTASQLPATTLTSMCYANMFAGCTSLTTAPELPATTLTSMCYANMFAGCTSITTAPELLATTLEELCYLYMFSGCTSLNYIKCLATNLNAASSCTDGWVKNVASSGTFVKAESMNDWTSGNNGIPNGWTVQNAT